MTGKTTTSDLNKVLLELSYYQGTYDEILSHLNNELNFIFGKNRFKMISTSDSFDHQVHEFMISIDKKAVLINLDDFDNSIRDKLGLNSNYKFIIPVSYGISEKKIRHLLIFPMIKAEIIDLLQIISQLTGLKIDDILKDNQLKNSLSYYTLGKISHELFHEIKNKITAASTFFQMYKVKKNDPEFTNNFSQLASKDLSTIQNQILSILNFKKENNASHSVTTAFSNQLKNCLTLLDFEIIKHSINVKMDIDENVTFPLNDREMKDVLNNLIINSIHALLNAKIKTIEIQTFSKGSQTGFIIRDSGCGISQDKINLLFEPFFTLKDEKGHGIGLYIVKKNIDQYKGNITVSSEVNKGSEFRISFTL